MRKLILLIVLLLTLAVPLGKVFAQDATPTPPYDPCLGAWCPLITGVNYTCAANYYDWIRNKSQNLWVSDPDVTALGKEGERSRQFLYWTLTHRSIDDHPIILSIWSLAKNVVYFLLLLIAAIFGLGIIIGQRANFNLKIEVWPLFLKILLLLLYVTFSARIVLLVVQLSDTMMLFFIEKLGVKNLFNIFFLSAQGGSVILDSETAYKTFKGCSNLNIELLDSVKTSKFMVHFTNMTYYMVGIMFILRKVVLWLLLFVSPFLALLMPFVFIRNAGWIWIGVFFQWLFYGPICALFLATLTRIWVSGIPYSFDFSRVNKPSGQVYRTAINILWGGPAQTLSPGNSANYVDTYAEYFIALVMLWACIILPWLLLRIFRDYCCAGIAAAGNTLGAIFDRLRQYPPPPPSSPLGPVATSGIAQQLPFRQKIEEKIRQMDVSRIEEIRDVSKVSTNEIVKAMDLSVSKLSDISRLETNDQTRSYVASNLENIRAPERVATPATREKFMHLREELMQRSARGDRIAQTILQASDRKVESLVSRFSQVAKVTAAPKVEVKLGQVPAITERSIIEKVSEKVGLAEIKTREVLSRITSEEIDHKEKVETVARSAGVTTEKVREIIHSADQEWKSTFTDQSETVREVSHSVNLSETTTREVLSTISHEELRNEESVKKVAEKT